MYDEEMGDCGCVGFFVLRLPLFFFGGGGKDVRLLV